ncbi:DUF6279 family lipoprotein [Corallincola spongiicola]|uniref:DUF6279 family lipoprotein n=1 Tax=Corallincola spongiicola TaxID=2520508 RepID=UPI00102DFD7A|nr:DUF6279 family lipoprotein [Corallincola spongiicola]
MNNLSRPRWRWITRTFFVLLVIGTLTACSTKMVYNYLDWIVPWTIDDYITLDSEQEAFVDRSLAQVLSWHRQEQLPLYAADLESLRSALKSELTIDEVVGFTKKARAHWYQLIEVMFPPLVEFGQSLSDEQARQLVATVREELDEIKAEHDDQTLEERQQEWREGMEEGLEDWLGALTDGQILRIKEWSETRTSSFDLWIAYRYRWVDELEQTLAKRNQPAQFQQSAEHLLLQLDEIRGGEYLAAIEKNRRFYAQMIVDISTSMTKQQQTHLDDKLSELINDLTELHREE